VENAVKHNVFKQGSPLIIEITEDAEYLIVRNRVNRRRLLNESTGIGLQNIKSRYAFESKKEMVFGETDHFFIVKLPKLI
jgi:LytS/YehU family sensor histidine kinase